MTRDIVRFLDQDNREDSYHRLFGRSDALPAIQLHVAGGPERTEATVREYCRSLRDLCKFDYVAEAVIMEPGQERIRYFVIFATHYYLGIEVFKDAEMKAVEIQNRMRERSLVTKLGSNPEQLKLGGRPSNKVQELAADYLAKAKEKAGALLLSRPGKAVRYRDLFCKAMAFPFVTPQALNDWLCEQLKGVVDIRRAENNAAKPSRRRLSTEKEDYVTLREPDALKIALQPAVTATQVELF